MNLIRPALISTLAFGGAVYLLGCEEEHHSGYYQNQQEKTHDMGHDYHARYGVEPPASDMPETSPDVAQPAGGLLPAPEPSQPVVPPPQSVPPRQP